LDEIMPWRRPALRLLLIIAACTAQSAVCAAQSAAVVGQPDYRQELHDKRGYIVPVPQKSTNEMFDKFVTPELPTEKMGPHTQPWLDTHQPWPTLPDENRPGTDKDATTSSYSTTQGLSSKDTTSSMSTGPLTGQRAADSLLEPDDSGDREPTLAPMDTLRSDPDESGDRQPQSGEK
jgi:hypothetical protein